MEVAGYVAVHVGNTVGVEVVACAEAEIPVFCGSYVSGKLRFWVILPSYSIFFLLNEP